MCQVNYWYLGRSSSLVLLQRNWWSVYNTVTSICSGINPAPKLTPLRSYQSLSWQWLKKKTLENCKWSHSHLKTKCMPPEIPLALSEDTVWAKCQRKRKKTLYLTGIHFTVAGICASHLLFCHSCSRCYWSPFYLWSQPEFHHFLTKMLPRASFSQSLLLK